MSVPKITITHPDSTVSTRQSKRPYLFGLVCSPLDSDRHRANLVSANEKLAEEALNLTLAIANPEVIVKNRGFTISGRGVDESFGSAHTFHNFEAHLVVKDIGDRWVASHCDSNGQAELLGGGGSEPVLDALIRNAEWKIEDKARSIKRNVALIAEIDAGTADLGKYTVVRWTSRLELGYAAIVEFSFLRDRGHDLTIVPVDAA